MRNLEPYGVGRRVFGALALLVGIAFGAHLVWLWLAPLMPTVIGGGLVLLVLGGVYRLIGQRHWWR